ncbi:MAG: ATP-binding protein [Candidatus Omnitrophica bacterium]|nr:ATP-binding protein [Candidatus Omnitrophota bacterium]
MNLYGISSILTCITSLAMAVFVYVKGYKYRLARIWCGLATSAAIYGFGAYNVTLAKNAAEALLWWQISYVGVILTPFFFLCSVYEFLDIKRPLIIDTITLLTFLFLTVNFFCRKLFIHNCTLYFTGSKWVMPIYFVYPPGPLLMIFILFVFFGWTAYATIELITHYRALSSLKRSQVKYFIVSAILGFVGGGASFLPCFGISFYPIFNFTVPFYFVVMSYTILRYRLMDITVAITRTGIFVVLYTFLLGIPFAITARLKDAFIRFLGEDWWMLPTGALAILATAGPFLYIYLQRKAEDRLLKEQRLYHEALREAGMGMTRIRDLQKLLDLIVNVVTKNGRIQHSAMYLYDDIRREFALKAGYNLGTDQPQSVEKENPLISWFENHKEPLVHEEIKHEDEEKPTKERAILRERMLILNAAVIVPSFLEGKLVNFLVLGEKLTKQSYTDEDFAIFSILANQIAVAIENAILYGSIEEQVKQRTKELMDVQKQLVQAEKLATVGTLAGGVAHEINNPLTAVLTNVQMLLESDTIDDKLDRESLELIEEATKRCRTIVQKLMTYARKPLETVEITRVNLLDALDNVLGFIGYQLDQDSVKINIKAKEKAYHVIGNSNEIEQVLTNLILNARDAIKQVKKGGTIDISFSWHGEWVKTEVEDEGAGIPKEITSKIFDPFFTTKDVGRGVGLGLSICQAIVEKHNGILTFKSEVGKGTTFMVLLPRAAKQPARVEG